MANTPDAAPAPLITNSFGNPVKYQSIQQWVNDVNAITHPDGLTKMWRDLWNGNVGHRVSHRFMHGTPDHDTARIALFRRAKAIGCHYSKVSKIFTWD